MSAAIAVAVERPLGSREPMGLGGAAPAQVTA
jgi:hypothetical protein